jgi:ribonucleotide monophosphatase NagD (HAD superfamily)
MVGDRIATDIAMGQQLGMAGVLVLSGATRLSDLAGFDIHPDYVIATLADVIPRRSAP